MQRTDTIIIGGGQAGLALSRCLQDCGCDHVVLERGRVAERWRTERWESLRLLTPNWQSRLPGFGYDGSDPDGFMTMPDVIGFLEQYAQSFRAPVETNTTVLAVDATGDGRYRVITDRGLWIARNVVVATGYCDRPLVPRVAADLTGDVVHVTPSSYRRADRLRPGGVLVVGASASGVQLADEIHASGRPVTLAVGRHTRLPRQYRGRDIFWWMDRMGILTETIGHVFDAEVSRQQPSLQLVGRPDHQTLGLNELSARGVRLVGRLVRADARTAWFDDSLIASSAAADLKLASLRTRIDAFIRSTGLAGEVEDTEPFVPSWPRTIGAEQQQIDLRRERIATVVWATGYRREYPWLRVPVLDDLGEIRQTGGVTPADGLYVLGLNFQRRRNSAFIDGVGADAREIAARIARRLDCRPIAAA